MRVSTSGDSRRFLFVACLIFRSTIWEIKLETPASPRRSGAAAWRASTAQSRYSSRERAGCSKTAKGDSERSAIGLEAYCSGRRSTVRRLTTSPLSADGRTLRSEKPKRHRGFESPSLRHTVFAFRDSPRGSLEIRAFRAQFASLAAPETREFEPYHGNFGILSLFRISLVPRENPAQARVVATARHDSTLAFSGYVQPST